MKKIIAGLVLSSTVLLGGCTWFDDMKKNHKSDTEGLKRTVTIYSKTGDVVKQYKGDNVRTKYNEGGALVINVDGKRLQIMNSDVVIEEKGVEKYETSN